jgi:hypothetical protein
LFLIEALYVHYADTIYSKMTQLDDWDTVYFNKAHASFENYEESNEL